MTKTPLFSIILPVYNVEQYLDRCVESILKQNFTDYEVILVDDGSKDRSSKMCDDWAAKDERIRVVHKINAGLGMARNTGVDVAKGEYVLFIDSDDYIEGELLQTLCKTLQEHCWEVVFWGMKRIDREGKVLLDLSPNPAKMVYNDKYEIAHELLPDFMGRSPHTGRVANLRISVCTCCIKRTFFTKTGLRFVSERQFISEDLWFYLEAFQYINSVCFLPKTYYCYCQNEGSLTFSYDPTRYERLKSFYGNAYKLVQNIYGDEQIRERLVFSFISTVMGCLKMEAANLKEVGLKETYHKIAKICQDSFLQEALLTYPDQYFSKKWKIFKHCILHKRILLLMGILLMQFAVRHV